MILKRFGKQFFFLGLIASTFLLGGWFWEKERPLLPQDAFLAAYGTNATKDMPVKQAFDRVFQAKWGILAEQMKGLYPKQVAALAADPFQDYFGLDRRKIEWSLLTVGALVRPEQMKDVRFPDMTWTFCGAFVREQVIETLRQRLQAEYPTMKLEASTREGVPLWTLKGDSVEQVVGLAPCITFMGKRLMLVASNERALQNLVDVYAGKVPSLSKTSSLWRVFEPAPLLISRLRVVQVNALLNQLTTEAERNQRLADPRVNAVVSSLRALTFETRLIPGAESAEGVLTMECADAANAQTLSELCMTAKVSASFLLNMALQQKPELKPVTEWLSKVNSRVEGNQATLSLQCSPQDIERLAIEKITDRQVKKTKPSDPNREVKPTPSASPATRRSS